MFDDIQFLSGKKQCQEEFFNIFNQLFGDHHQIVVTSDVYSKKVSLPDRLKTRLSQGATYEIKPLSSRPGSRFSCRRPSRRTCASRRTSRSSLPRTSSRT